VSSGEIAWRYRGSGLEGTIVVGAAVALVPEDPEVLAREIRQHLRWRKAGTPFDEPCCGSVFRNPAAPPAPPAPAAPSAPASPAAGGAAGAGAAATPPRAPSPTAGQLIDACGLKGFRIGGAEVSRKHANYIVNTGGATAADVLSVIDVVRERVFREFGVELELEVKLIGSE
jgi:UDP-N-acetylmuramate dehydrogenase